MIPQPHTPVAGSSFTGIQQAQGSGFAWHGSANTTRAPFSGSSSNNTYLLPTSPMKGRRAGNDNYKPKVLRTCGARPACLVNASMTYCGNSQIYAFGGFDRDTDEGTVL